MIKRQPSLETNYSLSHFITISFMILLILSVNVTDSQEKYIIARFGQKHIEISSLSKYTASLTEISFPQPNCCFFTFRDFGTTMILEVC